MLLSCMQQRHGTGQESAEQIAERLAGFLRIVKYQPSVDP